MSRRGDWLIGGLVGMACILVVLSAVAAVGWFGLVHTSRVIEEVTAFRQAHPCGQAVEGGCLAAVPARVEQRHRRENAEDGEVRYTIVVRALDRKESVDVLRSLYEDVRVGDDVRLTRFRGECVAVGHGSVSSATDHVPRFPFLAPLTGMLLLAILSVSVAAGLLELLPQRPETEQWRRGVLALLAVGAFLIALGILVCGRITDEFTPFDPRYIYLSFTLTPLASLLAVVLTALRWLVAAWPRLAPH